MAIETLRRGIEKEQKLVVCMRLCWGVGGRLPRPLASVAHAIYFGCSHHANAGNQRTFSPGRDARSGTQVEVKTIGLAEAGQILIAVSLHPERLSSSDFQFLSEVHSQDGLIVEAF
eukprot:scaffold12808_cov76-Skeletonema_dohrnii-CCMP3373.AAC.5